MDLYLVFVSVWTDIMWANSSWFLHRVDQESSEVPSFQSAQQHQTHLDSIFMVCTCTTTTFTSILFTIISMLHFLDQWDVILSNMDLMFGSMILVWSCHSYNILFQLLEENIVTFVKNELKKIQKVVNSDYPECLEREDGEDEEQWRSRAQFLKITVHFLRRMKQEELADCLQSSKRISPKI